MNDALAARTASHLLRPNRAPKRAWTRPELRRLHAGAAETAGAVSDDGVIGNS